jgi:uncharacterized protein YpuA (DUF1002 family)
MKKHLKRLCVLGITAVMMTSGLTVSAGSLQSVTAESTESKNTESITESEIKPDTKSPELKSDPADDKVVIKAKDKPYLALGADLSAEQKKVVLNAMGIKSADMEKFDVAYVTNAEEHRYLDAYISSSQIGKKSWSSVVIVKRKKGNGINISTKNINYCTIGMYKNALVTAGIADADIIVAGPKPISGTAALVGIFKAYTDMTGGSLSEEHVDTALNELVLTGQMENKKGASPDKVEGMVAYLKQQVADGALKNESSISDAIDKACDKFDVTLSDEEKSNLIDLLLKIKDLHLNADDLLSQAQSIYNKLSDFGVDTSSSSGIGKFFSEMFNSIKSFFSKIFS